ncbi:MULTISPECIES: condensation domain-containing protein [unclassified Streptomyces]|uniref:condensation domain-containing protein n=1 Tax=unclassified Streptomyces TaxID=2593676 RepID=UPI00099C6E60|nr:MULTISPECIES: condensation domain-containing protein [unclassified Streptomyces]
MTAIPGSRSPAVMDTPDAAVALLDTTSTALRDVLDLHRIDPEANFFSLGGNSLLAVRVAGRLSRALGQRIPATAVLNHPTARDLARHLAELVSEPASPAFPAPLSAPADATGTDRFPLSAAQRRVWLLHEVDPERLDHLVTVSFEVTGELDPVVARTAWHRVAERHEALRTRFEPSAPGGEEPCQVVESEPLTEFTFLDTVRFPEAVRVRIVAERVALLRRTPLSLRTGPLSRIALLRTAPSRYRLELIAHHIICDGWSLALLWQDFLDAYRRVAAGEPGPGPSPYRFRDHVRWERRTESARWPAQADRVTRRFADRPEELPLPIAPAPVDEHDDGDDVSLPLPAGLGTALARAGAEGGHTRLTLALAALAVLLHRISGSEDLVIAVPMAGRVRPEDEGTVGLFVNTALARIRLDGARDVPTLVARARDEAAEVLDCQTYPFDQLVSRLGVPRDGTRMPLARVSLAVQDFAEAPLPDPDLGFTWVEHDPAERQSKLDLAFSLTSGGAAGRPTLTVTYRPSLFRRRTVDAWAEQYLIALENVTRAVTGGAS